MLAWLRLPEEILLNEGPANKGGIAKPALHNEIVSDLPYVNFPFDQDTLRDVFTFTAEEQRPGLTALGFAGGFYLLDPASAFVPLQLSGDMTGQIVFDMCAAPGGKTVALALAHPEALIVANDISPTRARELARNVERMSLPNVVVTSIDPRLLGENFRGFFDVVLVDAPCSGSGMFRKDPKMLDDWTPEKVSRLVEIQKSLTAAAAGLLKEGGKLVYSTCSYSYEEDDGIALALASLEPLPIPSAAKALKTAYGYILHPGIFPGEGQYVSMFHKPGTGTARPLRKIGRPGTVMPWEYDFKGETYGCAFPLPAAFFELKPLKPGIKVSDRRPQAKVAYDHDCRSFAPLTRYPLTKVEAESFIVGADLKGPQNSRKEVVIVTYSGLPLGYGRLVQGRIKNLLPKGLYAGNIRI